ncbi:MAG: hypothetical protein L0H57_10740 [Yaniella sp.]|nr:hypothetical protein [Yaniella sp.]MDN5890162.1 hypothetical protein [Yaniella sp.]
MSTHLNEEQIERIAGSLFGKDPAEQTEMAKSQGMVPNEQGLIEFNRPIGFELDESLGYYVPIMGLISVEDAAPATDEEISEQSEYLEASGKTPTPADNATDCPYAWRRTSGGFYCFTASGSGPSYDPINAVRFLSAYIEARTQYDIYPYGHENPTIVNSPWRVSAAGHGSPSIYSFSQTVYGISVAIRSDV